MTAGSVPAWSGWDGALGLRCAGAEFDVLADRGPLANREQPETFGARVLAFLERRFGA